ncbi:hypothetical protein J8TS2_12980 [Lederbergia ruris]|uniref:Uncharacterized protein n=1 Tax=Lederbergia ruris TaxID=217495 RepID=A0ABQ4KIM8_9BACI|nr:hypothetical protein J8TS2_12980 [Lederbergia ruris]
MGFTASIFHHNGSSILVNFKNNGITNRTTSIKASSNNNAEVKDKLNIIENGIVIIGNKTSKEVIFLEDAL